MAYSTIDDLQQAVGGVARLVQLTDWSNIRIPDVNVVARAIAEADAEIDSFVGKQRFVPIAPPIPGMIVRASARIAKYHLMVDRGMLDDRSVTDYENIVKWLTSIRDGDNSLGVDPQPVASSMRIDRVTDRSGLKDVSRAKLYGFR